MTAATSYSPAAFFGFVRRIPGHSTLLFWYATFTLKTLVRLELLVTMLLSHYWGIWVAFSGKDKHPQEHRYPHYHVSVVY